MPSAPPVHRSRVMVDTCGAVERERGSAARRGYGRRWEKAARLFLAQHPICACGCSRAAEVVDHVRPHRGDAALFWDAENWQALTRECHARKTRAEGGRGY